MCPPRALPPQNKQARIINYHLELLLHASNCPGRPACQKPDCVQFRELLKCHGHGSSCAVRASCALCKKMDFLFSLHSRYCKRDVCLVPFCQRLRKRRELQIADSTCPPSPEGIKTMMMPPPPPKAPASRLLAQPLLAPPAPRPMESPQLPPTAILHTPTCLVPPMPPLPYPLPPAGSLPPPLTLHTHSAAAAADAATATTASAAPPHAHPQDAPSAADAVDLLQPQSRVALRNWPRLTQLSTVVTPYECVVRLSWLVARGGVAPETDSSLFMAAFLERLSASSKTACDELLYAPEHCMWMLKKGALYSSWKEND